MTIHLPEDLESSIRAEVHGGQFASVDEAMAEAVRLLLRELKQGHRSAKAADAEARPDPVLGAMREAADELDEIVADAMKRRREEPWRVIPGE